MEQLRPRNLAATDQMNPDISGRRARSPGVCFALGLREAEEPFLEVHAGKVTTLGTDVNELELPFHCIAGVPFRCHVRGVDTPSIRRRNFQYIVQQVWNGHRALVAEALKFKEPNLVTRYMSEGKSAKNIGLATARKIEIAARAQGAKWVTPGWMDVPHEKAPDGPPNGRKAGTVEQRIAGLPPALRQYLLMELEICEQVQHLAPADFMRAPSRDERDAFQRYLKDVILLQAGGRRVA